MHRRIKEELYFLKVWWKILFRYPRETLDPEGIDYDAYWASKRGKEIGALSEWQKIRADFVLRMIGRADGVSIGDIGCGGGSTLAYLGRALPIEGVGYDISEDALAHVRAAGYEAVALDVAKEEGLGHIREADYLLLLEVLEHVPHSEKLLSAAYDKARKGVFFSFPNSGFFIYRLRLLFGKFPAQWRLYPDEHVRFWTLADLKWWLKAQGYEKYSITCYKGIPVLNRIWPGLCAAGLFVHLKKQLFTSGEQGWL